MQSLQLGLVKLSFIFLFRRIFLVDRFSTFGIASLVMITFIILWTASFFLGTLFGCGRRFSAWWSEPLHTQTCIDIPTFSYAYALSDFIMDLMIVAMPVPIVSLPFM